MSGSCRADDRRSRSLLMRILLVTRYAWPHLGGTEVLVRTAARAMAAEHDVRVLAQRIDDEPITWQGPFDQVECFAPFTDPDSGVVTTQLRLTGLDKVLLAPYVVGPKRVGSRVRAAHHVSMAVESWFAYVASRRFARALHGADVVHRFAGNRMTLATVRAAHREGLPVVVTPLAHPGQWDDDEISATSYREADLVVATDPADAELYARLGVPDERLEICPLPSRQPVRGGGPAVRAAAGVDGPLILFLGVRRPYKGADELLGAAEILAREAPQARIVFVGPGPPLPPRAPNNVLEMGPVSDADRDAWLDAADIVCLPSKFESWGLTVSEAWSVGAPVVTSDIPILRQRVEAVGGGLAVAPEPRALADALVALLRDDGRRRAMGEAGRAHYLRDLSETAYAAWHLAAYERLIAARR